MKNRRPQGQTRANRGAVCIGAVILLALMGGGCAHPALRTPGRAERVTRATAARDGENIRIQFAVSGPTDVAVSVHDESGAVVRHLAAGRLGGDNVPSPFVANSLRQTVLWDQRDDAGHLLPDGSYRVRVRAGLTAERDRAFGFEPKRLGMVHGLAVGPDGDLYVMGQAGRYDWTIGIFRVFSPDGEYKRTILPRPADIPFDRAAPLGEVKLADGERFPGPLLPHYGGRRYQTPLVTPEGDLIFSNAETRPGHAEGKRFSSFEYWRQRLPRRLLRLAPDGGAPEAGYFGPVLSSEFEDTPLHLAMGPDGRVYISGALNTVFRVDWDEYGVPLPFAGSPFHPGERHLDDPQAIAFDGEGRLYVADRGNHRISVHDRSGHRIGTIPVERPRFIAVHHDTGAVYVTSGDQYPRLLKFDGLDATEPAASYELDSQWPVLAMDSSAEQAVLYVANVRIPGTGRVLVKLADEGDRFALRRVLSDGKPPINPMLHGIDRRREMIYARSDLFESPLRVCGRTGRMEFFNITDLVDPKANRVYGFTAGVDGGVDVHINRGVGRLDRFLRPQPFAAVGAHIARGIDDRTLRSFLGRGVTTTPDGDVYFIHRMHGETAHFVTALNADGSVKKGGFIVVETESPAGIRVDRDGHVYLMAHLKPVGAAVPDALRGHPRGEDDRFARNYGSVIKFGPEGGRVRQVGSGVPEERELEPGQMQFTTAHGKGDFVAEGVEWSYFGVSCIRPMIDKHAYGCICWAARLDLDEYGRVFAPDQLRHRVVVLDSAGNKIGSVGRYGNVDDPGPGIALGDPYSVAASDEALYVGDTLNQQIVRATLNYNDTRSVEVTVDRVFAGITPEDEALEAALAEARELIESLSPSLVETMDWDAIRRQADIRRTGPARTDDVMAVIASKAPAHAEAWPSDERRELLERYFEEGPDDQRLAAIWGLWDGMLGEPGGEWLRKALDSENQLVRVSAAYVLLANDDHTGLHELFQGVLADDRRVYDISGTALMRRSFRTDPSHPKSGIIEPDYQRVNTFPVEEQEVEALSRILRETEDSRSEHWFLRMAATRLLGLSGREDAGPPLLESLQIESGNNLNRTIGALGALRYKPAVGDILFFLKRGRDPRFRGGHGDRAEEFAATALARIADPESVPEIIATLDSDRPNAGDQALRCLTLLFDPETPSDRRAVPEDGELRRVPLYDLPDGSTLRQQWEAYWEQVADSYIEGERRLGR